MKITFVLLLFQFAINGIAQSYIGEGKIYSQYRSLNDFYGYSVDVHREWLAVGSLAADDSNGVNFVINAGIVEIYKFSNNTWVFQQELTAPDRTKFLEFGRSVSLYNNRLVVGATGNTTDEFGNDSLFQSGAIYIYKLSASDEWIFEKKLVPSDRDNYDRFGRDVEIYKTKIVVGVRQKHGDTTNGINRNGAGSAYIFELNVHSVWTEVKKLFPDSVSFADQFGKDIAINDNYIVVSCSHDDDDQNNLNYIENVGSIFIYSKNNQQEWELIQKIVAFDRKALAYFGQSVAISDSIIVVGAMLESHDSIGNNPLDSAGAAYIYKLTQNKIWKFQQKIVPTIRKNADIFGYQLDIFKNDIIVSALEEDEDEVNGSYIYQAGSVYLFSKNGNNWIESQKIVAYDRSTENYFGYAISLDSSSLIVGSFNGLDSNQTNFLRQSGSAYLYSKNENNIGFTQIDNSFNYSIFPNPTKDNITINFKDVQEVFQIQIFNSNLQLISSTDYKVSSSVQINLPRYPGIYFVEIKNHSFNSISKVVKF